MAYLQNGIFKVVCVVIVVGDAFENAILNLTEWNLGLSLCSGGSRQYVYACSAEQAKM